MDNILNRTVTDTYKGKNKVLKSFRLDKDTALKLDKFIDYCREENGTKISQNKIIAGIIASFIKDYENEVQTNPDIANKKVLALLN